MADVADLAGDYAENIVTEVRGTLKKQLYTRGRCLFCGTPVKGVFCDPEVDDCRDMWERSQQLKKINGR